MLSTTMTNKVFKDSGIPLAAYAREALCICPNCKGPALVKGSSQYVIPFWVDKARVQCLRCSFIKEYKDQKWYGPTIGCARERCPHCGYKWLEVELQSDKNTTIKQMRDVTCESCGRMTKLGLKLYKDVFSGKPYDPYFGLPLWLQADCCGKTFWAYNRKHLNALKSYIESIHRQRAHNGKWSMIARLPQWMKAANRREELLNCAAKLEGRLKGIE
jgi:hypothetical protein